jgi:starch synthase (maltosyl-transferring)
VTLNKDAREQTVIASAPPISNGVAPLPVDGRARVIIEGVKPEINGGRYPIKRTVGEKVVVEADIFNDGHDSTSAVLLYRHESSENWTEVPMTLLVNDRWRGEFPVTLVGRYRYTILAWVDHFKSWRRDMAKRVDAGQDVAVDLLIGAEMIEAAAERAMSAQAAQLRSTAEVLRAGGDIANRLALSDELAAMMARYPERRLASTYPKELEIVVDRERARFSSWYEFFPRSFGSEPGRHGTFKDAESMLPYVAEMGFDVIYLPPIHPVGQAYRKGRNNTLTPQPGEPGSPWAIGAQEGGHKAIHPELGTLEDFRQFLAKAQEHGIEIAMDIAFQASPDHPYVKEHPEWFRKRPDGTIQYAENPPKKYQDIYPFDFETEDWEGLWQELESVMRFWVEQGVRAFRVDNPHTKAFGFWEWAISKIKHDYPDVLFLSEAFTRPKVMYNLAKLGFTQSYTYFTWRNTKAELTQYLTELTRTEVKDIFRPNFWPNTPDILPEFLQFGGRPAFISRLILAATLSSNYGIYGPAYELCVNEPLAPGKEEYLDSEKFELKRWNLSQPNSIKQLIAAVNQIRRENPALQYTDNVRFHKIDNDEMIAYSKTAGDNQILVVVSLDPNYTQAGWLQLSLDELAIDPLQPYQVHDLLADKRYLWNGARNYVELNPRGVAAHIFRIRRKVRTEHDFDYYM